MTPDYRSILRRYWHYDDFRPMQEEIIESVGAGKDTLALLPTGGGKSICFQVPAMTMVAKGNEYSKYTDENGDNADGDGLCLVVTPLIALMKDQVEHLRERGIKAHALFAGQTAREVAEIYDACQFGHTRFLYVSPERLEAPAFLQRVKFFPVAMIAVDEAHCISQWGYDFRPSYLKIADIRTLFPEAPVLALTATATPDVVEDIQQRLHFRAPNVFRKSFKRENLSYVVRYAEEKEQMLLHILQSVQGSAIVYVRNRQKTKEISDLLNQQGITADYFHAGLANAERDARQQAWMRGERRVMVATNAFGMGIDKPDVRVVAHIDLPDSLEAYFQEAGRGGRDGERAWAVLLYNKDDRTKLERRIRDSFPERTFIKRVYEAVGDFFEVALGFGAGESHLFPMDDFCREKHLPVLPVYSALNILTWAGYWSFTEEQETPPRVMVRLSREQLYRTEMTPLQEDIVNLMLRRYTGVFTDPAILQEDVFCKELSLQPYQLREQLIDLARNGVITYIPRRKAPYLTYVLDRQPLERVTLTEQQYEDRQRRYADRLRAMLEYAEESRFCRQQLLAAYFGETDYEPCGVCDICLRNAAAEKKEG